jgi:hypothetical protein
VEKVTGIGGMFFRAENPKALRGWYADTLGVVDPPNGVWRQKEGLAVFPLSRRYGSLRTPRSDVHAQTPRARPRRGALASEDGRGEVVREEQEEGAGRFAWIVDPEGNSVEL